MWVLLGLRSKLSQAGKEPAPASLKDAPLGLGEAGEVAGREVLERLLEEGETTFDVLGHGSQRRGALAGGFGKGAARLPDEGLAADFVGKGEVGPEECLGLAA
jgi:hypothetical protein